MSRDIVSEGQDADHRKIRGCSNKIYNEIIVNEIIARSALTEICNELKIRSLD